MEELFRQANKRSLQQINDSLTNFFDRQLEEIKGLEDYTALLFCSDVFLSSDDDFDFAFNVFSSWIKNNEPSKQILFFWGDGFDPDCILIAASDDNNNVIETAYVSYGELVVRGLLHHKNTDSAIEN
jgi:hypothetical protein